MDSFKSSRENSDEVVATIYAVHFLEIEIFTNNCFYWEGESNEREGCSIKGEEKDCGNIGNNAG